MERTSLINSLIKQHNLQSYLEIGVQNPNNNFNKIDCENKVSVDPDPGAKASFQCTSDFFFLGVNALPIHYGVQRRFDLIFIDGLHHADQVEKDIINAMNCLNPGGFIVLHDCNPEEEWQQLVPRKHKIWYGDVWRAFVGLRLKYPQLRTWCYDFDCGCGVIRYSCIPIEPGFVTDISWSEFSQNRHKLLGIV